jgi:hypothetical protein
MRTATFTRFGKGARKLWVLRIEGGDTPQKGEAIQVQKKDGTTEEKRVAKVVWQGWLKDESGAPGAESPLYLCLWQSAKEARMVELARGLLRGTDAVTRFDAQQELAKLVLEKFEPKSKKEKQ